MISLYKEHQIKNLVLKNLMDLLIIMINPSIKNIPCLLIKYLKIEIKISKLIILSKLNKLLKIMIT
jgi:hypothetical protein